MSQTTFLGKPITVEMLSKVIDELTDREALLAEIARTLRDAIEMEGTEQDRANALLTISSQVIGRIDAANLPYPTHTELPMSDEDHRWHWHLNRGIFPKHEIPPTQSTTLA